MENLTKIQVDTINSGLETAELIFDEVQKVAQGHAASVSITSVMSITLFMRILDLYSGSLACIRIKKPVNSYILIRTLSEAVVLLKGVTTDKSFSEELHNKSADMKKTRLVKLSKDISSLNLNLSNTEIEQLINQTENDQLVDVVSAKQAYSIFKRFGELSLYHQIFAHCSLYTHNDPDGLVDYFDTNEDGTLILSYYKDIFKHSGLTLLLSMSLLIYSFGHLCKFLNISSVEKARLEARSKDFEIQFSKVLSQS